MGRLTAGLLNFFLWGLGYIYLKQGLLHLILTALHIYLYFLTILLLPHSLIFLTPAMLTGSIYFALNTKYSVVRERAQRVEQKASKIQGRKFCINCGAEIKATAKFCSECGAPQD